MPQLELLTVFSQSFWLCLVFILFYFVVNVLMLPLLFFIEDFKYRFLMLQVSLNNKAVVESMLKNISVQSEKACLVVVGLKK